MAGDDFFEIFAEVFVESHLRASLLSLAKYFGDRPSATFLKCDYRQPGYAFKVAQAAVMRSPTVGFRSSMNAIACDRHAGVEN